MSKILDTVLLIALPASGKSEVRKYMSTLTEKQCVEDFKIGPTLQLDDYPYVHFMHRIDNELTSQGYKSIFYKGSERPFKDEFEWGTLIHLLNEDYENLLNKKITKTDSAAQNLFDRIDKARAKAGLPQELGEIPYRIRQNVAAAIEAEVKEHLNELNDTFKQKKEGKTVIIEMARGGANGSAFPLTPPNGYQYSLSLLSAEILDKSGILYVWVTPEESRKNNLERARPDGQSSILFHGVPMEVMLGQYGCDDIEYLMSQSGKENTIKIERIVQEKKGTKSVYKMKTWNLPVARFDNRKDLTSFIRKDKKEWNKKETELIHKELSAAFRTLASFKY